MAEGIRTAMMRIFSWRNMQLPIFVNSLPPNSRDARTPGGTDGGSRVFDRVTRGTLPEFERTVTADANGEVLLDVSDRYVGGTILIHIRHRWYVNVDTQFAVPEYGVFYTAKLQHDYTFWSQSPSSDPEWDSEAEFALASEIKNARLRRQRYRNAGVRYFYYAVQGLSPFAGYFISGGLGIVFGLGVEILLEFLALYSIGLRRFGQRG